MSIDTDDVYPAIVPVNRESKTSHQTMQSLYILVEGLTAGYHWGTDPQTFYTGGGWVNYGSAK